MNINNFVRTHVVQPMQVKLAPTIAQVQAVWSVHGPTIMTWTGVALNAVALISAVKAGGQVERITNELVDMKDHGAHKAEIAKKAVKLYGKALWKPALSFTLGTGCIAYGIHGLSSQILGLAAAYDGLSTSYENLQKEYSEYVEAHPDDAKPENESDKETGDKEETTMSSRPEFVNRTVIRRIFDNTNPMWLDNPELVIDRIKYGEMLANQLLNSKKLVCANEYMELAGYSRSGEGYVLGSAKTADHSTNNYISFGEFTPKNRNYMDFITGRTNQLILEFSVDGRMEDLLKKVQDESKMKGWV